MTGKPGMWEPLSPTTAVGLFRSEPFRWWISGGHALELHVGHSWRGHDDLDIGISHREAGAAFRWLNGWELWIAAGGELKSWEGHTPVRGDNNVWVRAAAGAPWRIDFTIGADRSAARLAGRVTVRREGASEKLEAGGVEGGEFPGPKPVGGGGE